VVFDNGDKRKQAATDFVEWLTAADQVKSFSLATGDLPTRVSVGQDQSFVDQLNEKLRLILRNLEPAICREARIFKRMRRRSKR